jgi:hypothetical protein
MTGKNQCQPVFSGQLNRLGLIIIGLIVVCPFWVMVQTGCGPSCTSWRSKNQTKPDFWTLSFISVVACKFSSTCSCPSFLQWHADLCQHVLCPLLINAAPYPLWWYANFHHYCTLCFNSQCYPDMWPIQPPVLHLHQGIQLPVINNNKLVCWCTFSSPISTYW